MRTENFENAILYKDDLEDGFTSEYELPNCISDEYIVEHNLEYKFAKDGHTMLFPYFDTSKGKIYISKGLCIVND